MKKVLFLLQIALCLVACQEDELLPTCHQDASALYASMESIDATRTSMDEYNNVLWSEGDQLIAFMKTTLGIKYQIKEQYVGTTTGGFSKVQESDNGDDLESGQEIDHNVVIYPHSDQVWCMKYDNSNPTKAYKLNVVLPETQTYAEKSFGNGTFPMVAVSSTNQLTFKNICGGLKLQFKGIDKIKSIKLEGIGGEKISGKSSVVAYTDGTAPTITMASTASASVTLDCGEGVQLNESTPTTFIIAVPPVNFASGMKITVTDTDGMSKTLTNTSANTIKRSSLLNFPVITYKQEGILEFPEGAVTSYEVAAEGGSIEIALITNQEYEVIIPEESDEWISLAETKALRKEILTLSVAENTSSKVRSAEILITSSTSATLQAITICQEAGEKLIPTNPDEFALIDLGLSVKWANYNMGATTVYELGTSTDWGREQGSDVSTPTDMNISGSDDDLIKSELGGDWRLPTAFDFIELEQKCLWEPTIINGVSGNLVTGPNGNSIFLPELKYWTGTAVEKIGENHDYLYAISWPANGGVKLSSAYNRPVQGPVRVYPDITISPDEVGKNTMKVTAEIV